MLLLGSSFKIKDPKTGLLHRSKGLLTQRQNRVQVFIGLSEDKKVIVQAIDETCK